MRSFFLLPVLTIVILHVDAKWTTQQGCDDGEDCAACGPEYFSDTGGRCLKCGLCTDRIVASPCTNVSDVVCGSCARGYFEQGGRCVRCSLDPDNVECRQTTSPEQAAITSPSRVSYYAIYGHSSSKETPEGMGIHIIYVFLGLALVLVGLVGLLFWLVLCPKMKDRKINENGEPNRGEGHRPDIGDARRPNEVFPLVEMHPNPPQENDPPAVAVVEDVQGQNPHQHRHQEQEPLLADPSRGEYRCQGGPPSVDRVEPGGHVMPENDQPHQHGGHEARPASSISTNQVATTGHIQGTDQTTQPGNTGITLIVNINGITGERIQAPVGQPNQPMNTVRNTDESGGTVHNPCFNPSGSSWEMSPGPPQSLRSGYSQEHLDCL